MKVERYYGGDEVTNYRLTFKKSERICKLNVFFKSYNYNVEITK